MLFDVDKQGGLGGEAPWAALDRAGPSVESVDAGHVLTKMFLTVVGFLTHDTNVATLIFVSPLMSSQLGRSPERP